MFKLPYNHANFHMLAKLRSKSFKLGLSFPGGTCGKESMCQCRRHRDTSSIPWLGSSTGRGHSNPLQYSWLENPMERGAWWASVHNITKGQTNWNDLAHTQASALCEPRTSDEQAGFRKGRGTRDQIANIHWMIEKARESGKTFTSLTMLKPLTVGITTNSGKSLKR